MDVRPPAPEETAAVRGILNGAMLEVDEDALRDGETIVAVAGGTVVGALVLAGEEVDGVAVRPGRRGEGVGTALAEAAAARRDRLIAGFDPGVRPFYESLGFDVECHEGRCRGVRDSD